MRRSASFVLAVVLAASLLDAQVAWTNRGGIPGRTNHAMAYDAARGVVVVFGGMPAGGALLDDTWEWDGVTWTRRFPLHAPPPRHGGAMAFDAQRQTCVLVGGYGTSGPLGDTWAWDGFDWSLLAAVGPDPRGLHAVAYDSGRGRLVLFGGDRGGGQANLADTWEWDGIRWTRMQPAAAPPARYATAMAYDAVRQRVVLAGGLQVIGNNFAFLDDTYEWDPSAVTWSSGPRLPYATRGHAMAYDAVAGGVLLLGVNASARLQMSHYDGTAWHAVATTATPAAMLGIGLAFDVRRDRLVAFGGSSILQVQEATWEWDRTDWARVGGGPPGSSGYVMLYDAARRVPVLFHPDGRSSTSEWDGRRWRETTPAQPAPGRFYAAFGHDRARGVSVRYGGADLPNTVVVDETWTFDGTAWQRLHPPLNPGLLTNAAMAFDETRGTLLLFGGQHGTHGLSNETWEWNGTTWVNLLPASRPGPRQRHAMTCDRARGRVVLFGGNGGANDTWEWDGSDWHATAPAQRPSVSGLPALTYDGVRQRVVLFGAGVAQDEHWEWDGNAWTQRVPAVLPPPRNGAAFAHDEARECTVLFGGTLDRIGRLHTDTWELRSEVEAFYRDIGAGCGASGNAPRLDAVDGRRPWWGETFTVEVAPLPPTALAAALLHSASSTVWNGVPLPFDLTPLGAPGCLLRVGLDLAAPMQASTGRAHQAMPLPAARVLLGRTVFQQALVLAPGSNAAGLLVSSARAATVGTR